MTRRKPRREDVRVVLPRSLLDRINAAAADSFEHRDQFLLMILVLGLRRHLAGRVADARRRDGGKAPAPVLLRPLTSSSKRARVLAWFLHSLDASVTAAMAEFDMTRPAIFATWTTLHAVHGIGYRFDSASDTIAVRMPPGAQFG